MAHLCNVLREKQRDNQSITSFGYVCLPCFNLSILVDSALLASSFPSFQTPLTSMALVENIGVEPMTS
jgi:hypothetical protein